MYKINSTLSFSIDQYTLGLIEKFKGFSFANPFASNFSVVNEMRKPIKQVVLSDFEKNCYKILVCSKYIKNTFW